jgi:hypothetical protein
VQDAPHVTEVESGTFHVEMGHQRNADFGNRPPHVSARKVGHFELKWDIGCSQKEVREKSETAAKVRHRPASQV